MWTARGPALWRTGRGTGAYGAEMARSSHRAGDGEMPHLQSTRRDALRIARMSTLTLGRAARQWTLPRRRAGPGPYSDHGRRQPLIRVAASVRGRAVSVGGSPSRRTHVAPCDRILGERPCTGLDELLTLVDRLAVLGTSPPTAPDEPAIRRGRRRQPRGGDAAACSTRYRSTAAMSSASSSACCPTTRGTSFSRSWW